MPFNLVKKPNGPKPNGLALRRRIPVHPATTPPLPASPALTQVWIDFDGTITRKDVLDELIVQFAVDDSWRQVEAQWRSGEIGSLECLQREFALIRVGKKKLNDLIASIPIDPGFVPLIRMLREQQIPVSILSDGVEQFIRAILVRSGVGDVTIRSNRMEHVGQRLTLVCPHHEAACEAKAAHCKCTSAEQLASQHSASVGRTWVYIGDGLSDLCPARKSGAVFAKGALARQLEAESLPFIGFDTLHDVHRILTKAWSIGGLH